VKLDKNPFFSVERGGKYSLYYFAYSTFYAMSNNVKETRQVTLAGLSLNLVLAIVKIIFGVVGRSQAVLADAAHSLSDMATDVLVLIGIRFWSAPADECHPYGHQRIETLVTVGIASLLAATGLGLGLDAIHRLGEPVGSPRAIAFVAPLISIIAKEYLFRRTRAVGKRIHSSALIANAWHHRSDALSSIPALIAVLAAAANPKWAFLDSVGALIVSLLILKVAWDIAAPALSELTEQGASEEDVGVISNLALSTDGVSSIHRLRTRRVGAGWFVDLHAEVDGEMTVRDGHDIATKLIYKLLEEGPSVADVTVHIEPDES
jgi:cation diffusion facilitator family transporter